MKKTDTVNKELLLSTTAPSKAITKLAIPATLALLAKAVYNIVDTAYIGMLGSDIALAAVGVTLPLLLIMVSVENIFAAGAAVLAGRQLGANDKEGASRTITTIVGLSMGIGVLLCVLGIFFIEPLLRAFGASDAVLPQAKDYAFWMFIAAVFNLPAQSLNCAARAESSVKISTIAVTVGAALNVVLDPVFMFSWGLDMGVEGASFATTLSQCVTFAILAWFYLRGHSIIKVKLSSFQLSGKMVWAVVSIGIPTAVIQICLAVATSLTNIAAKPLPDADLIIAAYGVVQRLILIGCYVIMGFMQGYQPVASYAFGAKNEERFHQSARFALRGSLLLTVIVAALYIILSRPLILLFNRNPAVIEYGRWLLISQVALYPAFGLCYMMTITFQTIGSSKMGLLLSMIRQGLFYVPFILTMPGMLGVTGVYLSQPFADILTILVCIFLVKPMKRMASQNIQEKY
ncbi:MATE family efflux transporter [Hespellia stercorisuis]|uniref:Multidrug export protein MepA n=1 Tax=Hespellia stercorisuis DSM 15480 TaxID=1121950 RepID=A0A1M6SHX2_9FIRM|nr:MATE family efflux transporter [Hespellia stercorisuis]SHK44239.1 putative efflux protein, MATE family [Hespellia stercorisuis DSM 15480]